jgi:DNA-binding transcriptional LysR family regulator
VKLSLDLLRTFLAVHRSGSLTSAAHLLGLAQPTVTAQIRNLESGLNRQLFVRLPRGIAPTSAADELAGRVAGAVDELESIAFDVADASFATTVHLGGPPDFVREQVIPALAEMIGQGLQLRVTFGLQDVLLDEIDQGRLDLAIVGVRPKRRGIIAEALCDEEFALVAAPTWAERLTVVNPDALRDIPLIAYHEEAPIIRRYWRTVFGTRLTRTPDLVVPDLRGVLAAVVAGAGITVLPEYLYRPALDSGDVRLLTTPEVAPLNTIFLAYRPPATGRQSVAAVRQRLRDVLT